MSPSPRKARLGKGLGALLGEYLDEDPAREAELVDVKSIGRIHNSPARPSRRKSWESWPNPSRRMVSFSRSYSARLRRPRVNTSWSLASAACAPSSGLAGSVPGGHSGGRR